MTQTTFRRLAASLTLLIPVAAGKESIQGPRQVIRLPAFR